MDKWLVIEVNFNGEKRALEDEYNTYGEACEAQEAMEWMHDENSYLVYRSDDWVYECENS